MHRIHFFSPSFVSKLGVIIEPLDVELLIDANIGGEVVTDNVCKSGFIVIKIGFYLRTS